MSRCHEEEEEEEEDYSIDLVSVATTRRGQRAIAQHRRGRDSAARPPCTPASNLGVLLSPADGHSESGGGGGGGFHHIRRVWT